MQPSLLGRSDCMRALHPAPDLSPSAPACASAAIEEMLHLGPENCVLLVRETLHRQQRSL